MIAGNESAYTVTARRILVPAMGDLDRKLSALGDMTVATARDDQRVAVIANALDLTEATVSRRLNEAHGKTLVRNVFRDRWPGEDDANLDELGEMTAATARDGGHARAIATTLELSEATVSKRLNEAHGKTLVRNVFRDRWTGEEDADLDELKDMTAATARDGGHARAIANVLELSDVTVKKRLNEAHGKTLVRNIFPDRWRGEDDANVDELGDMTTATARDGGHARAIAKRLELSEATVNKRLNEAHGKTLVRNALEEHWPDGRSENAQKRGDRARAIERAQPLEQRKAIEREKPAESTKKSRPRIIVGSSVEGLKAAKAIQKNLDHFAECALWSQSFGLSSTTIETIDSWRNKYGFAILVLTPDDAVEKRGSHGYTPRDNVLFELGFFIGALGRGHTFVIHPREASLLLPTDLQGITCATYVPHSDGNLGAALGAACTDVEEAIDTCRNTENSTE